MKGLLATRFRGGILPLVLAISLIMASLCSIVLLLAYYHVQFSKGLSIKSKLQRNLASAIQLGLATPAQLPLNEWVWFDLYEEGLDSVGIHRSHWGIYELLQVKALQGHHHLSKAILLGITPAADAPALYLADLRRPISIAGDALIKGNAYLPEAGIKVGYVNRDGYSKSQLVFGKTLRSEPSLPPYESKYEESIRQLGVGGSHFSSDSLRELTNIPFRHPETAVFHSTSPIVLNHQHRLSGKLVIKSDKSIVVSRQAALEGVILLAPKIMLEQGFRGSLQAIATDTLEVGEGVQLSYPSAVGILQGKEGALLRVQAGASITGTVFLLAAQQAESNSLVWLHAKSKVVGQVYVQGYVQHEGNIAGSLYAQKLFLKTPSTIYENYLYNGQLDRAGLAREFVGSTLVPVKGKRKIIVWLD